MMNLIRILFLSGIPFVATSAHPSSDGGRTPLLRANPSTNGHKMPPMVRESPLDLAGTLLKGGSRRLRELVSNDLENTPMIRTSSMKQDSSLEEGNSVSRGGEKHLTWTGFDHPCKCKPDNLKSCVPPDGLQDGTSAFVAYCNGQEKYGTCGNDEGKEPSKLCCVDYVYFEACWNLNAWVRKGQNEGGVDTRSCIGPYACSDAEIPVIDSSCIGTHACLQAGKGGRVGQFIGSCKGDASCEYAGFKGVLGDLTESCIGDLSCLEFGREGFIGNVNKSCRGEEEGGVVKDAEEACREAGRNGNIGNVLQSCIGEESCHGVAAPLDLESTSGGVVSDIGHSCHGVNACKDVAKARGIVGNIVSSCNDGMGICRGYCSNPINSLDKECEAGLNLVGDVQTDHFYW